MDRTVVNAAAGSGKSVSASVAGDTSKTDISSPGKDEPDKTNQNIAISEDGVSNGCAASPVTYSKREHSPDRNEGDRDVPDGIPNTEKRIKIESDGEIQCEKNGLDNDGQRKPNLEADKPETESLDKYRSAECQLEYKENQFKDLIQQVMEHIIEEYFITYNISTFIDFYSVKKRLDLNGLMKYICDLCGSYGFTFADMLIKTLNIDRNPELISSTATGLLPPGSVLTIEPKLALTVDFSMNVVKEPVKADTNQPDAGSVSIKPMSVELAAEKSPHKKVSILTSLEESGIGTREQIVERAKKEAYVMQRIAELRKNGVWSVRRLPKLQEPPRCKAHWDYLLEEMQWLAVDFAQERKWKRNSAKKCAKLALKCYLAKASSAERVVKEEQMKLKRIANNCAKMVKHFWSDMEKVLEAKQELQLNEKRKKIHDMQLRYIVDKADHLTEKLVQEFVVSHKSSKTPSTCSDHESLAESPAGDQEFEQGSISSDDDEETIAKEEKDCQQVDYQEEIDNLAAESEMPIEKLLAMYGINEEELKNENCATVQCGDDTTADETEENNSENQEDVQDEEEGENGDTTSSTTDQDDEDSNEEEEVGSSFLIQDEPKKAVGNEDELTDIAAGAESIQPKGNTLSSVQVMTRVPFLLKYQLREYQHIGLDWLVAMYDKNLNGILADEMGLGKTIQTIALIAHLACEKSIWGPHLIVVPTSVMLNWEMEFKKWCPALKILTYFGNPKERRLKRKGWTKPDTFHVCITSYKLVIQDHQSFRRQKWVYLILDEAQHIKNFKSQRWQMLLNFNSTHRLLLTGTPLQNNLMELWSLMHFLMPNVFQSHREFKDWFDKPMTGIIEGQNEYCENLIRRLHKVLRPFLLRRLKCDVEKQLPKKYEHIVRCPLSKRQRFLYDEFMSLGETRDTLASGNFLSVINILMQLRKVCNHPNLFEPRPTISPYIDEGITLDVPGLITTVLDYDPLQHINLFTHHLIFTHLTFDSYNQSKIFSTCYNAFQMRSVMNNREDQIYVRLNDYKDFHRFMSGIRMINSTANIPNNSKASLVLRNPLQTKVLSTTNNQIKINSIKSIENQVNPNKQKPNNVSLMCKTSPIVSTLPASPNQKNNVNLFPTKNASMVSTLPSYIHLNPRGEEEKPKFDAEHATIDVQSDEAKENKEKTLGHGKFVREEYVERLKRMFHEKLNRLAYYNNCRSQAFARICTDLLDLMNFSQYKGFIESKEDTLNFPVFINGSTYTRRSQCSKNNFQPLDLWNTTMFLDSLLYSPETLVEELNETMKQFVFAVPSVVAPPNQFNVSNVKSYKRIDRLNLINDLEEKFSPSAFDVFNVPKVQLSLQLPETRLIQYDCGKLQILDKLLWQLKSGKHRVLIFTQMSRMLDILEQFLNYHGHTYLRLDGTTKIDRRQALMERFNADPRIFCFILSTRSGGVGVNLTGADIVIFYDSDWNPTMDAQAQDRCHRIGQTRDVHIYRLISERTVEENILKKAKQKKMLGDLAIEEGNFTTAFFKQSAIKDLFDFDEENPDVDCSGEQSVVLDDSVETNPIQATAATGTSAQSAAFEQALCTAEEDNDVTAAKIVRAEVAAELDEFDENIPIEEIPEEKSPEEEQVEELISQLKPVERYALNFIESSQDFHELKQAEEEMEQAKQQWQKSIIEWKKNHEESRKQMNDEFEESIMTCSRQDGTIEKVFMSLGCSEPMPIWSPPTPPLEESDLYIDFTLGFSYERTLMPESQLPPVYLPKEPNKRIRIDPSHVRKQPFPSVPNAASQTPQTKTRTRSDDLFIVPKSPFDRSNSIICRYRREILSLKAKLWPGNQHFVSVINKTLSNSTVVPPNLTPSTASSRSQTNFNTNLFPKWTINEEFSIILVLLFLQELPFNLSIIYPGHTPNWDFVTDQVNASNCFKRSAKFCKYHFESLMIAKEDQRLMFDISDGMQMKSNAPTMKQPKSSKKTKGQTGMNPTPQPSLPVQPGFMPPVFPPGIHNPMNLPINPNSISPNMSPTKSQVNVSNANLSATQLMRISQIVQNMTGDNNQQYTNEMHARFAAIKQIVIKRTPTTSKSLFKKQQKKYDMASVFEQHNIDFDRPPTVEDVAICRADRINREKQAREAREREQQAMEFSPMKLPHRTYISVPANQVAVQQTQFHPTNVSVSIPAAAVAAASANTSHLAQQSPLPQIILNSATASNANTFVASSPHVQHILSSKVAKLQNMPDGSVVSDSGNLFTANLAGSKMIAGSGHVGANVPSSQQSIHNVSLSHAQSMGLVGQGATSMAPLQPSTSESTTVSSLPHLQQSTSHQSQQTSQQFMIQPNSSGQPVPVNVSIATPSPISHKLFAIASSASGPGSGSNLTQVAQVTPQILNPGQGNRPVRQVFLRQGARSQLLQHQTLQASNIQVAAQPRHVHGMQSIRAQSVAQGLPATGNPNQRLQLVSNMTHSLISSGSKILATTLITGSTSTSNAQTASTLIGPQCILTSAPGHVIAPISSITNKSNTGNPQFIRTFRKDGVAVTSLKQNQPANQPSQLTTSNIIAGGSQTSQIFVQQSHQSPSSDGSNNPASQQSICLPGNLVKSLTPNISGLQATGQTQFGGANTFTLPPTQATAKILNQSPTTGGQLRLVPKPPTPKASPGLAVTNTGQTGNTKMVQQASGNTLIGSDPQQQSNRSANIITPMFQAPHTQSTSKASTFHFVSSSNGQPLTQPLLQSSGIAVNKTVSLQHGHPALKGNIIVQQQTPPQHQHQITTASSGQSSVQTTGAIVNPLPSSSNGGSGATSSTTQQQSSSANFILAQQQQHLSSSMKTSSSSQQHFIAVSSNDSSVNATTIKLLPTSAGTLAIQQPQQAGPSHQQQSSGTPTSASGIGLSGTPKGHIIISGHGASIVGQSGQPNATTVSGTGPTLLHQVVNNQSTSNSNQTLTFAIRTAHGQTITQPQPSSVHLSTLTLKNPSVTTGGGSGGGIQHSNATVATTQQQNSALVAALSQTSSCDQPGSTAVTASSALLRSFTSSNVSAKAIPIVLMQSSGQNPNLITQTTSGAAVSLINIGNTVSSSNIQQRTVVSNKITTATQTSGATLGSILSAAAKVSTASESTSAQQYMATTTTSKPSESPLIEALMSSVMKPPPSNVSSNESSAQSQLHPNVEPDPKDTNN